MEVESDPKAVSIVPVKRKHLPSLQQSFETVAGEKRYFVRRRAPTRSRLKQLIRDADKRDLPFFVALDDQTVVGWVMILFPDIEPLAHSGTLVMGVLPEYRRRGIGTRLLADAVCHAFQDKNRCRLQLEVFKDNAAAIALYETNGFKVEGVAESAVFQDGRYRDIVHMARLK